MELTVLVFLPAVAAVVDPAACRRPRSSRRSGSRSLGSLAALAISVVLFFQFDLDADGFQFVERHEWVDIGSFNLQYFLGVDGLSMPLVVLTTFLTLASVLVSFSVTNRPRAYYACLMVLATSVLGVFCALDFLLFFLFWELELFPMFLLIAIWGSGRKEYSATKFVLYTIAGSAFMLRRYPRPRLQRQHVRHRAAGPGRVHRHAVLPLGWVFALPVHRFRREAARSCRSTPGCRMRTATRRPPSR